MHTPKPIPNAGPMAALTLLFSLISVPVFAQAPNVEAGDDDPMSSLGLSLRAGIEMRTGRNFGSVLRYANDALRDAAGEAAAGITIGGDVNAEGVAGNALENAELLPENAPFRLPQSENLVLAVALNFGSTIYYRLEPNVVLGGLTSLNVYNGLGINLHFGPVYLGVGIGGQLGYMLHNEFNGGFIASGRVPIDLHIYLGEDFALLAEAGFSWGMEVVQPAGADDLSTASSSAMDFSLGIRFP